MALSITAPPVAQRTEDLGLAQRISLALQRTGYRMLGAIEVTVHARSVRLVGRVPSYYLKQLAQETVLALAGTHELHNGLKVVPPK